MGRCLIVANQTLGGEELDRAVRDCISRDVKQFYVVVPQVPVEHETSTWRGGFDLGPRAGWLPDDAEVRRAVMDRTARQQEAALEESLRRARDRLSQMINEIRSAGGEADGHVGPQDPVAAAKEALEEGQTFTEVIVSTFPSGLSRWLKMDLPSRVARMTAAPVTIVEAVVDDAEA